MRHLIHPLIISVSTNLQRIVHLGVTIRRRNGTLGATMRRRIVHLGVPFRRRIVTPSAQCAGGLSRLFTLHPPSKVIFRWHKGRNFIRRLVTGGMAWKGMGRRRILN